ncbi:GNAT family N-acetyltransferase [Rhizobiales bacterium]|uniref:GNAT family N-acetyltransferase n=1 Tax=Hongsoonwoonella zoysiae TaxID=2821844 RepID=UPI0015606A79|nr:GNAT family N-acetyltransferase [Hongsoonwoonella zoysiae]NRG16973.1 GNAT family N-acetyltransferase [Hongsoonwoonella zoysiae]
MSAFETLALDPGEAAHHRAAWAALADSAVSPNPFFGPDFLLPYLDGMANRPARLHVLKRTSDGAFLAAAPFARRRFGLVSLVLSAEAGDYGPLGTPLVSPQCPQDEFGLWLEAIANTAKTELLVFPYLRSDDAAARLLKEAAGASGWTIEECEKEERAGHGTGEAGEAQAKGIAKTRRKELDRQFRRLSDMDETHFESIESPDSVIRAFKTFLTLEASGWKGRQGTALNATPERARFAREFVEKTARNGNIRIDALFHGGEAIAMLVLVRSGSRIFAWKIAYDETFARYSPGAQLARMSMRANLESSEIEEADSLAIPGHSMIAPLWRGTVPYSTTVIHKGAVATLRAKLLRRDIAARKALKLKAKAILKR